MTPYVCKTSRIPKFIYFDVSNIEANIKMV